MQHQLGQGKGDKKAGEYKDPFNVFGHGIQSYFRMIRLMLAVMAAISILFIPIFYMYYHGGAFNGSEGAGAAVCMLGNLGHAESSCVHQYISIQKKQQISCTTGKISGIMAFGLMPDTGTIEDDGTFEPDYCADPSKYEPIEACTAGFMRSSELIDHFNTECKDQKRCEFDIA